ncbi:putative bifunctional diguanylate cyclase/phosphodiesterase [Methylibium petroleiphilum]|uniref:putative bifunctional diguanylate cyclase/phosphodiesterase n=1 Tax=Methylibium petroleiphilum TaxID=105560 RepID=UPI002357EC60|nr:EAL domain-containing protein [Methylibium petroleiphilum]
MSLLQPVYDPRVVVLSIAVAILASFVTLELAKRVRSADRVLSMCWCIGGALVMGSGIWSMHFVGMQAFSLTIPLGYRVSTTLLSWGVALLVSLIALGIAGRERLSRSLHVCGALAMGGGIMAMHYVGMAALEMAPGIQWHAGWVAGSGLIAVLASAAALQIFFWMRRHTGWPALAYQGAAAVVMGLAISGMHYSGMAAAGFPEGSACLSLDGINGDSLVLIVSVATVLMLSITLVTSVFDRRMHATADGLSQSLQQANERLQSANDELSRLAYQDALTGLPNRSYFEMRLNQAVARIERLREQPTLPSSPGLAVLFIDLDGFKPINDFYGHAHGDLVLQAVAVRLREAVRAADTLARLGGDEFIVLVEDVSTAGDCIHVAKRALASMGEPLVVVGQQVHLSCSIGVAMYPAAGDARRLIAHADAAMYEAKRGGGSTYAVYEAAMDQGADQQVALYNDLVGAMERGELQLHYQPKVDLRTDTIRGVEALMRWRHPQRGMVNPVVFIPVAERFGLINTLGAWVIDEACRQLSAWADEGLHMRVAINLSAHQLMQADLTDRVADALALHKVEASQLICEITESVAMEDTRVTQRAIDGLLAIGVQLSIDDFGTGYSSLSYLRQLRARQLKIDRSFVRDLAGSSDARAVVDAVIRLAHALGMQVVAEGVEEADQRDLLAEMGCDQLQGFLYARPMAADDISYWARHRGDQHAVPFSDSTLVDTIPG